jgi:hypothetical protein
MALSNFLSKLNWRLILTHIVACWFIYHALNQLGYLYDYKFLEFMVDRRNYFTKAASLFPENAYHRLSMDLFYAALAGLVGILIASVISLVLSVRNKWLWLNSMLVFLLGIGSFLIDRFYWKHVKVAFMFLGIPFKSDWWFNFIGGVFMLAVGLYLFFGKKIIRFIDDKNQPDAILAV